MNKQLKDISAAIAALNGSHIATIDNVKVGMPVFSAEFNAWSIVKRINWSPDSFPIKIDVHSYMANGSRKQGEPPSLFLIDPINGTLPPEPEIDWSQIDLGTDIIEVSNDIEVKFISYNGANRTVWYLVNTSPHPRHKHKDFFKLAPHVDIKPEWVKK